MKFSSPGKARNRHKVPKTGFGTQEKGEMKWASWLASSNLFTFARYDACPMNPEVIHIPRAQRYRVLKSAKAVLLNEWSLVDCTVRDISETGAKIICRDQAAIPNDFRLLVVMDSTVQHVRVVWRRGDMLGVQFTSEKSRAPARKF